MSPTLFALVYFLDRVLHFLGPKSSNPLFQNSWAYRCAPPCLALDAFSELLQHKNLKANISWGSAGLGHPGADALEFFQIK
jgi:hypothetical protein